MSPTLLIPMDAQMASSCAPALFWGPEALQMVRPPPVLWVPTQKPAEGGAQNHSHGGGHTRTGPAAVQPPAQPALLPAWVPAPSSGTI